MHSMMTNEKLIRSACPTISTTVDSEVREFLTSQLVLITLTVGTLFGLWLWMLNWSDSSRRDQ